MTIVLLELLARRGRGGWFPELSGLERLVELWRLFIQSAIQSRKVFGITPWRGQAPRN